MAAEMVTQVLDRAAAGGVGLWLDGGWGVDALLGEQTRDHEDADVVVALGDVPALIGLLAPDGYRLAEDHLPTRAVLEGPDGRSIDLHPVTFDADGVGWQAKAMPDGGDCPYPADDFVTGWIGGRVVPCVSAALQVAHHSGYEPRQRDRADMLRLTARFGLAMPSGY